MRLCLVRDVCRWWMFDGGWWMSTNTTVSPHRLARCESVYSLSFSPLSPAHRQSKLQTPLAQGHPSNRQLRRGMRFHCIAPSCITTPSAPPAPTGQ